MSNDVHVVLSPTAPIPAVTRTLKSYTATRANELLGRRGPFWAEETFDRILRNAAEFARACTYVENNPVKAGLVVSPEQYRWSSAWDG
jgi:putative transposase